MDSWDGIKSILVAVAMEILAYFRPLGDEIFILAMIFLVNFFAGLLNDIIVHNDTFHFRKAWRCITEITVFFGMVVFIYTFGEKKGWNVGAVQCVSFLTYVISWFYTQNIVKNMKAIFPEKTDARKVFEFLYYLLSVEFVKKIPYLKDFMTKEYDRSSEEDTPEGD